MLAGLPETHVALLFVWCFYIGLGGLQVVVTCQLEEGTQWLDVPWQRRLLAQ